jgi:Putative DNA-binding domain
VRGAALNARGYLGRIGNKRWQEVSVILETLITSALLCFYKIISRIVFQKVQSDLHSISASARVVAEVVEYDTKGDIMSMYESETIELKEAYTPDLKKEVVAFANSNGGTIYIGVTDR